MSGKVGLRLGFEFAACDQREEVRVGCVVGVCKARAELWRCGSYLGGQGGIGVLVGLWRVRQMFPELNHVGREDARECVKRKAR